MSRKRESRTGEAVKRYRYLQNRVLHISNQPSLRTLKRSARKERERERAPQLRIAPWVRDPAWRLEACVYPPATLLGLPAELRQQILYEICKIPSLEEDYEKERFSIEDHSSMGKGNTMFSEPTNMRKLRASGWGRYARGLIILLCRKIGTLCCVAPLIRLDMQYVGKRWESDLERLIERRFGIKLHEPGPRLPVAAEGYEWLFNDKTNARAQKGRWGHEIAGMSRKVPGKRVRALRCWYCMERHLNADPVCPPARRDRAKWQEMTRKVGGRRGSAKPNPTYMGKKVVFNDR